MRKRIAVTPTEIQQLAFDHGGTVVRNPITEQWLLLLDGRTYVADARQVSA